MSQKFTSFLTITFLLALQSVRSWWCTGHMLVAQVAYDDLKLNSKLIFRDSDLNTQIQRYCKSVRPILMSFHHFLTTPPIRLFKALAGLMILSQLDSVKRTKSILLIFLTLWTAISLKLLSPLIFIMPLGHYLNSKMFYKTIVAKHF